MSRVAIKLCGITEERDAIEAAILGVDAVGFRFDPDDPRAIDPDLARRIADRLPPFVARVGVFGDVPLIRVIETARRAGVQVIQFGHAANSDFCAAVAPMPWFKSVTVDAGFEPEALAGQGCTTFLLDARLSGGRPGLPWRNVRAMSIYGRLILGGGFDVTTVGMAIDDARPYGVDILDEVEFAPGKKDLDRLELLVESVRRAERRILEESRR